MSAEAQLPAESLPGVVVGDLFSEIASPLQIPIGRGPADHQRNRAERSPWLCGVLDRALLDLTADEVRAATTAINDQIEKPPRPWRPDAPGLGHLAQQHEHKGEQP